MKGGVGVEVASAFEAQVEPLLQRARAVARRVLVNPALAEEAVQEALLRAYRFWSDRRGEEVWPWLRRMVIHECSRASARDAAGRRAGPVDVPSDSPEETALRREDHAEVRAALALLPAGYRRVILLRYGADFTERDIACILGLPLGTVKWRSRRALGFLGSLLTDRCVRPLADTLREVGAAMRLSVSTGLEPKAPGEGGWPGPAPESRHPQPYAAARAAVEGFDLPEDWVSRHAGRIWLMQDLGKPAHGVCVKTPHFEVAYLHFPGSTGVHFHTAGQALEVDEPTRIGGGEGRWWQIDGEATLSWWAAPGRVWQVQGKLPPPQLRRLAEEVAALVGVATPEQPQPPRVTPTPPPVSLTDACASVPGFQLPQSFVKAHDAVLRLDATEGEPAFGVHVQVKASGFVALYRSPEGADRFKVPVPWADSLEERALLHHRTALWWREDDRLSVSWSTPQGGQWIVTGRLAPGALRVAAESVVRATATS